MKEDILEQLVEDYLNANGYFTRHNVKFRPDKSYRGDGEDYDSKKDSSHSDIDVIGFNPKESGFKRVWVVDCKSWQHGFSPKQWTESIAHNKIRNGRKSERIFRVLAMRKWADAFLRTVEEQTGTNRFTYVTAVTKLLGSESDKSEWESNEKFRELLGGNPIKILTLREMLDKLYENREKTIASSNVGRLLQVIRASEWKIPNLK